MSITLKDKDNADVVYTLQNVDGNTAHFVAASSTLLGRSKLSLSLQERANTNRIVGKLSIPTVLDCPDQCKVDSVAYTEVGSFDLSAVLAADSDAAANFIAQFKSLVTSTAVTDMFLFGTSPR